MRTEKIYVLATRAVFCVATALLFCTTGNSQEVAWSFESGDGFVVSFDQESFVTSEFNLIERKIGSRVQLTMDWNVTDVSPEGVATIDQTITRIVMTMHVPQVGELRAGQEAKATRIVADTGEDATEADGKVAQNMLKQIQPLVNANFTVTMQPNGEIDSVNASAETLEVIRNAPGSMQMRELLTPEGLKDIFGQTILVLPKTEFEKGETWEANREATSEIGTFTITDQFTFEGESEVEGETLTTIAVSSNWALSDQADETETDDAGVEFEGVNSQGTMRFDASAKHFVFGQFQSEYNISQPIRDSAINTNTTSTLEMRIRKK